MDADTKPGVDIIIDSSAPEAVEDQKKATSSTKLITKALKPVYCTICGLPPDYCEFGDRWEECRPTALKLYPQYYSHLLTDVEATSQSASAQSTNHQEVKLSDALAGLKVEVDTPQKPSKKKGKEVPAHVTIQRTSRAKRSTVTVVIGLDLFGVKMDKAAKLFAKHFSCGASFVKAANGLPAQIDVQGDIEDVIAGVITSNFPEVPADKIEYLRPK